MNARCRIYCYPIYGYLRHIYSRREEPQDLTQGYLPCLLQRGYRDQASREKGKFRAFLLADVKLFLSNERRKAQRLKRDGGVIIVPLQLDWAEERYGHEPVAHVTPDQLCDRQWAMTLHAEGYRKLLETVVAHTVSLPVDCNSTERHSIWC